MHDPMPDRDGLKVLRVTQPGSGRHERGPNIANLVRGIGLVDQGCLVRPPERAAVAACRSARLLG